MTAMSQLLRIVSKSTPEVALTETDGDLLRRYADRRDEAAFTELVRRNGAVVLQTCRSVLGNATAAEDAFQAVFLDLARKAVRLARPGSVAGWLHAAAVRTARAARRANLRRRRREQASAADPKPSPDERAWREVQELLDAELAALPEAYRAPLVLCYLQNLTYEEAARRIGCTIGALRGRLERGKERLRTRLARYGLPLGLLVLVLSHPPTVSASLVVTTIATVRTGLSGGSIPAVITGLLGSGCQFRMMWFLPALLVGVALAAGTPAIEDRRFDSPPPPRPGAILNSSLRVDLFDDPLPDGVLARLGTTRCRADVFAFGIQPDGTVVTITGGQKGVIQTWGLGDDRPRTTTPIPLPDTTGVGFPCVDISPDGQCVLGSTATQLVVQKRTKDGLSLVASFDVGRRRRQTFSADGTQVAVAAEKAAGRTVCVCNVSTKKITELDGSTGSYDLLSFSGDGTHLIAVAHDQAVLWDVHSGKKLATHALKQTGYRSVDLSRTGEVMAAIGDTDSVIFVDPKTGKWIEGMAGPPLDGASWIRFAPDGRTVLIGGQRGIRWWDPGARKLIRAFEGVSWFWGTGRFTPDGKILVSHTERMLLRWDATTGKPLFPAAHNGGHPESVRSLDVTRGGKIVVTASADGIRVWAAATGKPLYLLSTSGLSCPELRCSPDGRFLYAPIANGGAVKWDLMTGKQVLQYALDPTEPGNMGAGAVWLSPDGSTLMTFCNPEDPRTASLLTAWDTATGKRIRTTRVDARREFQFGPVVISPDGRWLGASGAVFPVGAGQEADRLAGGNWSGDMSPSPVFSADSRLVAVTRLALDRPERPMVLTIHEVATGATVLELPPESGDRVAFHPDGRSLVIAGSKGLTFWDLATGKEYAGWKSSLVAGALLRYAPDGSRLLTAVADTTSLVWRVPQRQNRIQSPTTRTRTAAWDTLGSPDGAKAWAAVWTLADDAEVIDFLRARVKPVEPLAVVEFRQLLADLGADEFATRVAAAKGLEKAGERVVGQLRQALKTELTAEQRQSVQRLLAGWAGRDRKPPTGEHLRGLRAVAALELAGTAEARTILAVLARGVPDAVVTREAKRAMDRAGR